MIKAATSQTKTRKLIRTSHRTIRTRKNSLIQKKIRRMMKIHPKMIRTMIRKTTRTMKMTRTMMRMKKTKTKKMMKKRNKKPTNMRSTTITGQTRRTMTMKTKRFQKTELVLRQLTNLPTNW